MTRSKPPLTELRDADITRVDAVKGGANGTRFIIAKASAGEEGLVPAATVRDLIAPTEIGAPDTYLGANFEIVKAELTSGERNDLPDSEFGFVDEQGVGHYPINDAAHVRNALSRAAAEIKAGGEPADIARKALPKIQAAAHRMGIGEPAADVKKEQTMDAQTETQDPPITLEEARSIIKRAKLAKQARKLAKVTADLAAYAPVVKADKPSPQADPTAPDADGAEGDEGAGDDAASDVQKGPAPIAGAPAAGAVEPITLEKAKAIARAAKLAKRTARDELATEKARRILAKVGRRNSSSDQAHVDAIDTHAAALGASAHQAPVPGQSGASAPTSSPTLVTKAEGEEIAETSVLAGSVEDVILKAIGPLLGETREQIDAQLSEVSQQLAKVSRIALPGGPRVLVDRDGSVIQAAEGERGLTFDQAALVKMADQFPEGSINRENLQKAAAQLAIKDLMVARDERRG